MRVIPRPTSTSTCPLCRAEVTRWRGVTCETCGSVAHANCVHELGDCHGTRLPQRPRWSLRRPRGQAYTEALEREASARAARAEALREWRAREDARATRREGWNRRAAWGLGLTLGVSCLATVARWGPEAGFAFAIYGSIMSLALVQIWSAITTGRAETLDEDGSEFFAFEDRPIRFLFATVCRAGMALLLGFLALDVLLKGLH